MNKEQAIKTLKQRQEKVGWSDYKLKKETGLTKITDNPTLSTLVSIASALGMELIIKNKKP